MDRLGVREIQISEPTAYELAILRGLQSKQVYGGTVPASKVRERRRRSKAARISRRINRGR